MIKNQTFDILLYTYFETNLGLVRIFILSHCRHFNCLIHPSSLHVSPVLHSFPLPDHICIYVPYVCLLQQEIGIFRTCFNYIKGHQLKVTYFYT